jgi:two-component system, chemotaxis family, chemotaxis protein CheY
MGRIEVDVRILVVEDSEITRRMIRAVLETRDWTICGEAENGLAGVKQFQSLRPDIVVLDLTMPDIDGLEAAHRMSNLNPRVPLILFTLCDLEEIMPIAHQAGIYATVSKHRVLDLVGTIESAMEDRCCPGQSIQ